MAGTVILGSIAALLGAWALLVVALWLARPRDVGLAELLRVVPDLIRLTSSLARDRATPPPARLALVGLLAWLLSPVDLIPEFIPVLGPLDDVVVAILVLRYVRRRIGRDEMQRRWPGTPDGYQLVSRILG